MKRGRGALLIAVGWVGMLLVNLLVNELELWATLFVITMALVLWGCAMWVQDKGRHWAFTLWGLLAPIGLLGISLLKDKTKPLQKEELDPSKAASI